MKPINPGCPSMVKAVRRQLALSQEDLARELGVSYATVRRWENGRAKTSPLALKQIEDLLRDLGEKGRDLLEELFGGEK